MNASTPVPVLLISAQADAETISAIEALLARMEPLLLERRTLDEWLENPRSETRLVCLLSDAELRRLLADARVGEWQIAVLPIKRTAAHRSASVCRQIYPRRSRAHWKWKIRQRLIC